MISEDLCGQPGQDLVLAALARALLITLDEGDAASPLFLDQLMHALRLHLMDRYGHHPA